MPEIPEPQAISIDLSKLADIRGSRQSAAEYEAAGFHDHEIRTHSSCTTMNGTWEDGYVLLHTNPYVHHQAAQAVSSPIGDENDEERCFWEEMDEVDSIDESDGSGDDEKMEANCNELEDELTINVRDDTLPPESGAPSEWSQFITSAEGVSRYMEEAAAQVSDVSILLASSPPYCPESRGNGTKNGEGVQQTPVQPNKVDNSDQKVGLLDSSTDAPTAFNVPTYIDCSAANGAIRREMKSSSACVPACDEPRKNLSSTALDDNNTCSGEVALAIKQNHLHDTARGGLTTEHDDGKENEPEPLLGTSRCWTVWEEAAAPQLVSPSTTGLSLEDRNGGPDDQTSFALSLCSRGSQILPVGNDRPSPSAKNQPCSNVDLPLEVASSHVRDSVLAENGTSLVTATSDLPWLLRSFEAAAVSTREHENKIEKQMREIRGTVDSGVGFGMDACVARDNVVAFVTEEEILLRIQRERKRAVKERQKRWSNELQRAKRTKSAEVVQAVWRGRRARATVSPALAARRRELNEMRCMLQEEELCVHIAAMEAKQKKAEHRRQRGELDAMRCEEKHTRLSWISLARREEIGRQEELARMRAEERRVRALLDLEREDSRRAAMIRRQAEESSGMRREDLAARDLARQEKARSAEVSAMTIEDELSKKRAELERRELAKARAEGETMAVEETESSIWNSRYQREREAALRRARTLSTPLQRAMDPKRVAAARRLLLRCRRSATPMSSGGTSTMPAEETTGCDEFGRSKDLITERYRRRRGYRERLMALLQQVVEVRRTNSAIFGRSMGLAKSHRSHFSGEGGHTKWNGQVDSKSERETASSDRGVEDACSLTSDMISHLGPLPDITGLELCVEGLTSASLLRACTSLKSLSLNVNRFSSPGDLVANTALVRLELRDNRLSSLPGLSGLPNLRELRLDINHITSLHELQDLPALVELSANINHIREIPEGFAAGLLSSTTPNRYSVKSETVSVATVMSQSPSVVVEAVARGGLQRLELYHNRIASVHHRALEGCGSLTHLDLGRNQLETLDGRGLECCPSLSTLVLSQNFLREPPAPLRLPLLTELWLSGNRISSMGDWARAPSPPILLSSVACSLNTPENIPSELTLVSKFLSGDDRVTQERATTKIPGTRDGMDIEGVRIGGNEGISTQDHREGMWLPSLEILHLQDNMLTNMGGFWSLAGSPLLRSLDASFNRLGTPDDFGSCLRGCGDLEEVRLHDNPAAGCEHYVDVVALSCPQLAKLDGNTLDFQANWRAGCNTYMGRADLVLPFLLRTTASITSKSVCYRNTRPMETVQVPNNNLTVEPSVIDNATSAILSLGSNVDAPRCPWCVAGATTSDGNAGTVIRGDKGAIRRAEDWAAVEGVPRPNRAVGKEFGGKVSPIACVSCGCRFRDTGHWAAAPFSQNVRFSARWEALLSAGHRWQRNTNRCTMGSENAELDREYEELVTADITFRRACLRHRADRSVMRHRHRREERDLESTKGTERKGLASVPSRTAGATVGESSADSRSSSSPRSRQRLEIDLELKEKHARERAQLVAEQLSLHYGIGGDRTNLDEGAAYEVVRSCRPIGETMIGHEYEVEEKEGGGIKSARKCPVRCHRIKAATKIQRFWRQWRATPNIHPVESERRVEIVDIGGQMKEKAVTKLQSTFRGFHVRQSLKAALESAEYVDEELEGLLGETGGARFDLDRFLSPPPELAQEWWEGTTKTPCRSLVSESITCEFTSPRHIRPDTKSKMIAAGPAAGKRSPSPVRQSEKTGRGRYLNVDEITGGIGQVGLADTSSCAPSRAGVEDGRGECARGGEVPEVDGCSGRPGDGMHDNGLFLRPRTTAKIGGLQIAIGETAEVDVSDKVGRQSGGVRSGGDDRGGRRGARNELVRAWGLKDPRVARAMTRRMQRMRKFETGEARRERLKDPDVRFNAFVKNAGDHRATHPDIESTRSETGCGGDTHRSATLSEGGWSEGGSSSAGPILASIKSAWTGNVNDRAVAGLQPLSSTHLPSLHDDNGTRASSKNNIRQERQAASPKGRDGQQPGATISWPSPPQPTKLQNYYRSSTGGPAHATLTRDVNSRGARSRPRAPLCAHDLGHNLDVEACSREHAGGLGGRVGRATSQAAVGRRVKEGGGLGGTDGRGSKQRDVGRLTRGPSCFG